MTQAERITTRLTETLGTAPEHLWARYPDYAVYRHPTSGKWYAVLMLLPRSTLSLPGDGAAWALVFKADPLLVGSLLAEEGFRPAYHMNKERWITAVLDDTLPDERILPLLEMSYDAVTPKPRRKGASLCR